MRGENEFFFQLPPKAIGKRLFSNGKSKDNARNWILETGNWILDARY
jgi:hypothetical protein